MASATTRWQQFSDAVRHGVRADGAHLYPAMPYTAYAKVTDDDTAALYAYFMHGVAAVDTAPASTDGFAVPVQHPPVDGGLESALPR